MLDSVKSEAVVAYFGYGSLVNRATHRTEIVDAVPARLKGWRRRWQPNEKGSDRALLSVRRDAGATTDGLLVIDRAENLPAIELREQGYRRVTLTANDLEISGATSFEGPIHVYEGLEEGPSAPLHIFQSYLDAVLQGFLHEYGEAEVRRFVYETEGFDAAVLTDREGPLYPRAVVLSAAERTLFDALLEARGIRFVAPQR